MSDSRDEPNVEQLTTYLRQRTVDSLRSVFAYDADKNIEIYFLREDLRDAYNSDVLSDMVQQAVDVDKAVRGIDETQPDGESSAGLGNPITTFYTFADAVVLQVFNEDEGGIIASFERDVATTHVNFIRSVCRELGREDAINTVEEEHV